MDSIAPVDLRERLEVLFWQEMTSYKTEDYLGAFQSTEHPANLPTSRYPTQTAIAFGLEHVELTSGERIKEHWREIICEWAYNLVDHFDLPRERVSIFANLLDRYLQKYLAEHPEGINKRHFQLLSLTCLYVTIKLECHQGFLSMDMMLHLSREKFSKSQMADMEKEIFRALEWKLHPPTPYVFLQHFLLLLPAHQQVDRDIIESARFSIELAVLDYRSVNQRSSRIALAALLNALEDGKRWGRGRTTECHYDSLLSLIDPGERETVGHCGARLSELGNSLTADHNEVMHVPEAPLGVRVVSPVSVARNQSLY